MRFAPLFAVTLLALLPAGPVRADNEIAVEPGVVTPGQKVTLRWYFTGIKVVVSGGRFGKGIVVTGRQELVDRPRSTTRYTFDVIYRPPGTAGAPAPVQPVHVRYYAVAQVFQMPPLTRYHASIGWQVSYVKGWQHDDVRTSDMKRDGLAYFQPEDDSVERLGVAVVPVKSMTAQDLLQQVQASMPNNYNQLSFGPVTQVNWAGSPALRMEFTGLDQEHPNTKVHSVVMVMVRSGLGYVVSARTWASRFQARQPLMERLVESFSPASPPMRVGSAR